MFSWLWMVLFWEISCLGHVERTTYSFSWSIIGFWKPKEALAAMHPRCWYLHWQGLHKFHSGPSAWYLDHRSSCRRGAEFHCRCCVACSKSQHPIANRKIDSTIDGQLPITFSGSGFDFINLDGRLSGQISFSIDLEAYVLVMTSYEPTLNKVSSSPTRFHSLRKISLPGTSSVDGPTTAGCLLKLALKLWDLCFPVLT